MQSLNLLEAAKQGGVNLRPAWFPTILGGLWPAPPFGLQEDCVLESMLCEQETLPRASPCLVDPRRAGNSSLCTAFMRIRKKAPLAPGGPGHKQKASWLSAHAPLGLSPVGGSHVLERSLGRAFLKDISPQSCFLPNIPGDPAVAEVPHMLAGSPRACYGSAALAFL